MTALAIAPTHRHSIGIVFEGGNAYCDCGHLLSPPPKPHQIVRIRPMTATFLSTQPQAPTFRPTQAA